MTYRILAATMIVGLHYNECKIGTFARERWIARLFGTTRRALGGADLASFLLSEFRLYRLLSELSARPNYYLV